MQSTVSALVTRLIQPVLDEVGIELVEIQFRREPIGMVLRLIIDKIGGIGIDDCARISREVAHLMEVEDPIDSAYHLEVSSPGLDRPLETERDFLRNVSREVKITLSEPPGQQLIGTIIHAEGDEVRITSDKEELTVQLENIAKAKLVY